MRFSLRQLLYVTVVFAVLAFLYTSNPFPSETRALYRYHASRSALRSHLVSHFPKNQPDRSANPVFSFFPGMLQGGAWIQLRVETSHENALSILQKLESETGDAGNGSQNRSPHTIDPGYDSARILFHTYRGDEGRYEFPPHFKIYIHHAKNAGGAWNHGEAAGTAVSTKTNEVIYCAENW